MKNNYKKYVIIFHFGTKIDIINSGIHNKTEILNIKRAFHPSKMKIFEIKEVKLN